MDFSKLTGAVPTDGETEFFHPIGKYIGEEKEKPTAEILEQISIPVLPEESESIFASEQGELFTISAVGSRGKTSLMLQYILNHPEKKIYFFSHEPAVITAKRFALMMFDTNSTEKYEEIKPYAEYIISSLPVYVNDPILPKHSDRIIEDMQSIKDGCIFIDGFDFFLSYLKNGGNPYVGGKTASDAAEELKRIAYSVPVTVSYLYMKKGNSRDALIAYSDKYATFFLRNNFDSMFADKDNSYAVAKFKVINRPHPDEKEEFTLRKKIYKSEAWFKEQKPDAVSRSKKIFIGGTKKIKTLDETVRQKLDKLISESAEILIGDCRGADAMVQSYLHRKNYEKVKVYATDGNVRINHGNWPVVNVPSYGEEAYEYYQLKDIEMVNDADEAFMIWDGISEGTAFNIKRMRELGKRCEVFIPDNEVIMPTEGVFWLVDDELFAFPWYESINSDAAAKSGRTYNHKKLWQLVKPKGCDKPFDYYPRGRVVVSNKGEIIIYMNPNIDEKHIPAIKAAFNMWEEPVIRYDYSEHYKCYLDE